ncbi:hypothetical protein [Changpingibacter yushuensis]|uniref:hypothetical protein n=1 Tax=Changpingibacter yushuensis TaxID=2758440 RepID=UPI0015F6A2CB|nr:hypothetical protein [Changpingibacter yushuensis]
MMKTQPYRKLTTAFLIASMVVLSPATQVFADDTRYQLGEDSLVNTGKDNGFSRTDAITKDDVHWGWQIGGFYVSDFTRVTEEDGNPVLLKNVGDEVALWFEQEQDIDRLNGDDSLSVAEDKNGWDQRLQVAQQNFGRGMLIVKHTDYKNDTKTTVYSDFLSAEATTTAATQVGLFEEGDYEVALDYELKKPRINLFGWKPAYEYTDYQITFEFSVRNGNSMVFPFDVKTGEELTNAAATPNGFRLDLARSRYLDIDIRREVLNESSSGLVEDTRFNKPAKDGSEYTDEGTYTITVHNRYTDQETEKTIYVGTDEVLKAHAATGRSISSINSMLADGATIAEDGSIKPVNGPTIGVESDNAAGTDSGDTGSNESDGQSGQALGDAPSDVPAPQLDTEAGRVITGLAAVIALVSVFAIFRRTRRASEPSQINTTEND